MFRVPQNTEIMTQMFFNVEHKILSVKHYVLYTLRYKFIIFNFSVL